MAEQQEDMEEEAEVDERDLNTPRSHTSHAFDDEKCEVFYKNNKILRGYKDSTTDLWTLPIFAEEVATTTPESSLVRPQRAHMMLSHHVKHAEAPIKHAMVSEQPSPWVHKSCVPKPIQLRPGPWLGRIQCNPIVETARFSYA